MINNHFILLLQVGYLKFEGFELAVNEGKLSVNYGFLSLLSIILVVFLNFNDNFENCMDTKPITAKQSNKNDDVLAGDWGQMFLLIQFASIL